MKNSKETKKIENNFSVAESEGVDAINLVYETEFNNAKEDRSAMKDLYEVLDRKMWAHNKNKDLFEAYKSLHQKTKEWVIENYRFCELEDFFA